MLLETWFADLGVPRRGKVRDIYDLGDTLLIVATDRVSAFDVVLPTGIPDKGKVLNQLSLFWFRLVSDIVKSHVVESDAARYPAALAGYAEQIAGRSMIVRKAGPIPVECVVRGYLAGSGWAEYRENGTVCGVKLPAGLQESQKLGEPIFTPTTKAEEGHDLPISQARLRDLIGVRLAEEVGRLSLEIYKRASSLAETRGILIADTKFEFGIVDGETIIIDEILTPDSSRFWSARDYAPGRGQDSFDKQIVRDYLSALDWDKTAPGPDLPAAVAAKTAQRYREIYEILTGGPIG
jgi:phosphoribosylaminoimidazole-succinocarboxamide synthase